MKWIVFVSLTSFIVILLTVFLFPRGTIKKELHSSQEKGKASMTIISNAFENNKPIPFKYTCDGVNVNPPLTFNDVPSAAQSLVLIVDDPDAPNGTWHHWSIYNMDPKTTQLAENTRPITGKEGVTDFGTTGYGGPCPPSGNHRYFFKLYALDSILDLSDKATHNEIENAMQNHVLSQAELVGLYFRSK